MNLSAAIPQLFYDLIGRVIPGTTLFIIAFYVIQGHKDFLQTLEPGANLSFSIVVAVLFASYLTGALLGGVWFFITKKLLKNEELEKELKDISKDIFQTSDKAKIKHLNFIGLVYDHILLWNPSAGSRIAKLSAEQHMCGVFILGTFILAIVNVGINFSAAKGVIWMSIYLLIGTLASLILYFHLRDRFATAIKNHWALSQLETFKSLNSTPNIPSSISK